MYAQAIHVPNYKRPMQLLLAVMLTGTILMSSSCGGGNDSDYNDGSSVKPAQDAFGEEYDRRRRDR